MRWPIPAMGVKFANPSLELGLKYLWPSLSCTGKLCLWTHFSRTNTRCFASLPLLHHYHPVKFVIRHCVLFQILVFFLFSLIISKWFKCSRYFFHKTFFNNVSVAKGLNTCIILDDTDFILFVDSLWTCSRVTIIHFSSFTVVCICDGCFCNRQYGDTLEVCWCLELDEGWDPLTHSRHNTRETFLQ